MNLKSLVYLLPLIGLWRLANLEPPVAMIAIAVTLFVAIKTHSLVVYLHSIDPHSKPSQRNHDNVATKVRLTWFELVVWYGVWWGLNPAQYFEVRSARPLDWLSVGIAAAKMAFGVIMLAFVAPKMVAWWPLAGGWAGMVGIVFAMHFGYSHLSALVVQAMGRPVKPIMNAPILANSVAEFWGQRWNLAFRDYAHTMLFSPLSRRWGVAIGTAAGFLFSGAIHELAISVPAGGGFGWPMLYFLIQGMGVVAERWMQKRKWLRPKLMALRVWAITVVAGPILLLFHQPFVLKVIVPIVKWCDVLSWVGS